MSEIEPTNKLQSPDETQKVFDLLREIATDKSKIKQLNGVKKRLDKSIGELRSKVNENEKIIFAPYESQEPPTAEDKAKQFELLFED